MLRDNKPIASDGITLISLVYFFIGILNIAVSMSIFTLLHPFLLDFSLTSRLLQYLPIFYTGIFYLLSGMLQMAISYGLCEMKTWAFITAIAEASANSIILTLTLYPLNNNSLIGAARLIINTIIAVYLICKFPRKRGKPK